MNFEKQSFSGIPYSWAIHGIFSPIPKSNFEISRILDLYQREVVSKIEKIDKKIREILEFVIGETMSWKAQFLRNLYSILLFKYAKSSLESLVRL